MATQQAGASIEEAAMGLDPNEVSPASGSEMAIVSAALSFAGNAKQMSWFEG